jgi:hypothetical protein
MIKNAKLCKEIVVTVVNKIGVLEDMSKLLADHAININAVAVYAQDGKAIIMLVTDDNLRAMDALKKAGYGSLKERETVMVELENKPGALKALTVRLAENDIDITQIYGTTCPASCPATIMLSTSNNDKALVAFKKK